MTYAIYNPYAEEFWTKAGGKVSTYPTLDRVMRARVNGQRAWKRENGTELSNGEAWIVVYEPHHRTRTQRAIVVEVAP